MFYNIHNSYDIAAKYSIISNETCKVTYMAGSVDKEQCIFPHDLLVAKILKTAATDLLYICQPCYKT